MVKTIYQYESLATREGFNRSLSHFKSVSSLLDTFENHQNLADILNELIEDNELEPDQINPILYALLVDKYGYAYKSYNMAENLTDFTKINEETVKWKAVDIVIGYVHPELGMMVINPKNREHWKTLDQFKKDELVTIFVGGFQEKIDTKVLNTALSKVIDLLNGKKSKTPQSLLKGKFSYKQPPPKEKEEKEEGGGKKTATKRKTSVKREKARETSSVEEEESAEQQAPSAPAAVAKPQPSRKRRISPMYSVPVTNELFHNGNVEAWKRIINSYLATHPGTEVYIFYEGEKINDINTLFKWGKVKHGSAILFAVAGDEIKDIAKLQRYLKQGASPKFEDFLKYPVNQVLNLF
jgi:hypothetical protein